MEIPEYVSTLNEIENNIDTTTVTEVTETCEIPVQGISISNLISYLQGKNNKMVVNVRNNNLIELDMEDYFK